MDKITDINLLKEKAKLLRRDVIMQVHAASSGHPGGSLSAADVVTALFYNIMNQDPQNPEMIERDRFILSKGHCCPILYAALARTGYFDAEELKSFRRINSRLQGHPAKCDLPFVETSSGPLGQGLSVSVGIALGHRLNNNSATVFCMLGDGELDEGQVWEAILTAAHYRLDNLIAIVDYNRLQIDGFNEQVKNLEPLADKWRAFNWRVIDIDGHKMDEILMALNEAKLHDKGPVVIIARTIKGKGVSFMENQAEWHGKAPDDDQAEQAWRELE